MDAFSSEILLLFGECIFEWQKDWSRFRIICCYNVEYNFFRTLRETFFSVYSFYFHNVKNCQNILSMSRQTYMPCFQYFFWFFFFFLFRYAFPLHMTLIFPLIKFFFCSCWTVGSIGKPWRGNFSSKRETWRRHNIFYGFCNLHLHWQWIIQRLTEVTFY